MSARLSGTVVTGKGPGYLNAARYVSSVGDAYAGFVRLLQDAYASSIGDIEIPRGLTLSFSQAVKIDGFQRLRIMGEGKIIFPSANTALGVDAAYNSDPANKRSGFYIEDCEDVSIEGLTGEGDDTESAISVNMGLMVSAVRVARLRMVDVKQRYGGGLVSQTELAGDAYGVIERCYSYGSRLNSRLGDEGKFKDCHFELPTDADWDRRDILGVTHGSSSGIYHFSASGDSLQVTGCTFKNIRIDAIKVSGSAAAMADFLITDNDFIDIGKDSDGTNSSGACVAFGANDVNEHNHVSIHDNHMYDCMGGIVVLGARSVSIQGNHAYFSVAPVEVGSSVIGVSRFSGTSQPVESVLIKGNIISAKGGISPSAICNDAIRVSGVGVGGTNPESVSVIGNKISNVGEAGLSFAGNNRPLITANKIVGTVFGVEFDGDARPLCHSNHIVNQQNNGAQIRGLNTTSFPDVYDNEGGGYLDGFAGKPTLSASGGTAVQWPIGGKYGYVVPADERPEVVFAYGSGWANGDTVEINPSGATLVYGTHFSSAATLIAAIEALANFTCADYGAPWGITTNHPRVRWHVADNTALKFYVKVTAASPLAGVILMNDAVVGDRCYSRGNGPDVDLVIWSPHYKLLAPPTLSPENTAAQTAMNASTPLRSTTNAADEQASCTMKIAGLVGTEQFTWRF